MYKLYYFPGAASLIPHIILNELELEYELILVDTNKNAHKASSYLEINPHGKIPSFIDVERQLVLYESAAICLYLCEKQKKYNSLIPSSIEERGCFYKWLMYLLSTIQPLLMVYHYPSNYTTKEDNTVKEVAQEKLLNEFKYIDSYLFKKKYLLRNLSICDFFLLVLVRWSRTFLSLEKYPNLRLVVQNCLDRESVKKTFKAEGISQDIP